MTQKTCPKCGYVNNAANPEDPTDSCPKCGVVYAKAKPQTKKRPRKRPVSKNATQGIGSIILFVLVGIGVAWLFAGGNDDRAPLEVAKDATDECMARVMLQLKYPESAEFTTRRNVQVAHVKGDQYLLQSSVDAKNGFGVKQRLDYYCNVEVSGQQAKATNVNLVSR